VSIEDKVWNEIYVFPSFFSHSLTVRRLKFKPSEDEFVLASCGNDNTVRVFRIAI